MGRHKVKALREAFFQELPTHLLFRKMLEREQTSNETTEVFLCVIRALLSELPYDLLVQAELDIVFGLLH